MRNRKDCISTLPDYSAAEFYLCKAIWTLVLLLPVGTAIMCSQCDSMSDPRCELTPPPATPCAICDQTDNFTDRCLSYTEYHFCITMRTYANGNRLSTTRSCNPISIGADCEPATDKQNNPVMICLESCDTDGCNVASRRSPPWILAIVSVIVGIAMRCGTL